jgi:DNA-binding transcriptional LysR family regulator
MLINNLSDLQVFTEIVKQGSLSNASKELGISIAVVSKRLKRLELKLDTSLIVRSTRTMRVTDEGKKYFKHCQYILSAVDEAENEILHKGDIPKGQLKISVPAYFGQLYVAPLITDFLTSYPEVDISINFSDQFIDIIKDGYDLAVRIDNLQDSGLISKKIGIDQRLVVASPAYIEKYGKPLTPLDLQNHNILIFSNPAPFNLWSFYDSELIKHDIKVAGNFETNNCESLNKTTLSGLGVSLRPKWDVWRLIESGDLISLLPEYNAPKFDIQAVYPSRDFLPHRVRLFIELLNNSLARHKQWNN